MYAGQIIEVASAADFFAAPKHPYARLLLRALPDSAKRGDALAAIPGMVPPLWLKFEGCRFAPRCDRAFAPCPSTPPELIDIGGRSVRCLLYENGQTFVAPGEVVIEHGAPVDASTRGTVSAPAKTLLEVGGLSVRFPIRKGLLQRTVGAFTAVDDISFGIGAGETLALVGESGCGKTTTGKAIVQLLRGQALIEGKALFDGQDLFTLQGESLRAARRQVQIIFQDPFASLNPRMRVFDLLEEGLQSLRPEMTASDRRAGLERLLDQVGLRRDALDRYPHEFSGGQRQRIAIARALALDPDVLVADEAVSALDVSVQAQVLELLDEIQARLGIALLFITHDLRVAAQICDDVAVMQHGRIVEQGPAAQVLTDPQQAYTRQLLDAAPGRGWDFANFRPVAAAAATLA
jgi:peptide/nickel transport system ATP-binding protein